MVDHLDALAPPSEEPREKPAQLDRAAALRDQRDAADADLVAGLEFDLKELLVPDKETIENAKRKLRAGERPSTAVGEFIREEMLHVREGKHGTRSPEQAIASGLSKARRAGIPLPPPSKGAA